MSSQSLSAEFRKGLVRENPVLGLMLGLCSVLAVSTEVKNAVGMGVAMTAVLIGANLLVSLMGRTIPGRVRLPVFIVAIASFTTIVDLVMNAWTPALHRNLGIFIPLIVVNCIIIARAEAFAAKHGVAASLADALGMGAGYTLVLVLLAATRELLGAGTLWGHTVIAGYTPLLVMLMPPGAFIMLGLMMAGLRRLTR